MAISSAETILFEVSVQADDSSQQELGKVDQQVDGLEQSFADLQQRSQLTADQLRNATVAGAQNAEASMQSLSSSVSTTSNQLAFELVQGAQDAQFGLAGVANQIPLVAEQFGRLQNQTGSTSGALTALLQTFKGPTGLLAIGTLGLQALPQILEFFQGIGEGATTAKERVKQLRDATSQLITGFREELPEFQITDPEAAKREVETLQASADARQQLIEDAEKFQRQQTQQSGRILTADPALRERFGDIDNLDEFIQRQQDLLAVERAIAKELESQLQSRRRAREAQPQIEDLEGVQPVRGEEFELPDTSFQAGEAGFVKPPNPPEVIPPSQLQSIRTTLTLTERIENELSGINNLDFLPQAARTRLKVQAIADEIRRAAREGREVNLQQLLDDLDAAEVEAKDVREALSGQTEAAEQGNQALAQQVRLSFQLAQNMAQVTSESFDAQQAFASILQTLGQIVAVSNPVAGAVISGIGGLFGSFDEGGYTGDVATGQVAGVVHGQEYVFSAEATRGNEQLLAGLHDMMRSSISVDRALEVSGLPGYAEGGLVGQDVAAMTQPVVSVSAPGGGGGRGPDVEAAIRDTAERTARRVAEEVADRPVRLYIGGRAARDVQLTADRYQERKSPSDIPPSQ